MHCHSRFRFNCGLICLFAEKFYYHPQRSWGNIMFLHMSVILFMGGRGGLSHCMLGYTPPLGPEAGTPQTRHPPVADTPRPGTPPRTRHPLAAAPPAQCMLGDTANKRVVRILLECNLVCIICNVDGCRICGVQFHDFITMIVALNCQLFLFVWDCKVVDFLFLNEAVWSHCLVCNI